MIDRQRDAFAGLSGLGAVLGFATAALIACACAYVIVALYYWHAAADRADRGGTGDDGAVLYSRRVFVLGVIHRRLVGPLAERFLMPLFDKKDKSRYATFTRRSLGLGGGMTVVFAVLAGRLYQLQIRDGDEYMTEAEDNRINERLIAPPRGRILDRFGVELANNRRNYRVLLVAEQATDGVEAALDTIGKVIQLTDAQKKRVLHDIAQNKKFVPVPVAENLSWEEFARINLHLPYLPGVQPDVGETRDYPFGDELVACAGLCRGGVAGRQEERRRSAARPAGLPHRQARHREGSSTASCAARPAPAASRSTPMAASSASWATKPGVPGKDVWLTIDRELQQFADQRLGGESAACVVIDVATGDVLALASTPGYDPNLFNVGITPDQWRGADRRRSQAAAQQGRWPASIRPARPSRPAMALAAVDSGPGTPDYRVDLHRLDDARRSHLPLRWKNGGHGHVDLQARHPGLLRRLLLRSRRGGWASTRSQEAALQAGPGRAHRHRIARRASRLHPEPRLEAGALRRSLAAGRHAQSPASARAM